MKWDIDKMLQSLEPNTRKGTSITRVMMELRNELEFESWKSKGLKPTDEQKKQTFGYIWCIGLGFIHMPKAFFFGQTIREAFLKARKAAKAGALTQNTPWGVQDFTPKIKRRTPKKTKRPDASREA